ncbi:MAG: hypothetical protein IT548_05295 [Alphaproteobacteria bacterium]|nr:hypothetical protein [Alphaproteobacteria bacterium]
MSPMDVSGGSAEKQPTAGTTMFNEAVSAFTATRSPDSVAPNRHADEIMISALKTISPQLEFLGVFHTHPSDDLKEATTKIDNLHPFEFSPGDKTTIPKLGHIWTNSENRPINLLFSICHIKKVHSNFGFEKKKFNSLIQFNIGQYRFWINGVVGFIGAKKGKRTITRSLTDDVEIRVHKYVNNTSGARLTK